MRNRPAGVVLTRMEKAELSRRANGPRRGSGRDARRARVILLLAQGASWQQVMRRLHCSRGFIAQWLRRFRQARIAGMRAWHHGGAASVRTPALEARIVEAGRRQGIGRGRLTTRRLAARFHVSHMTVHRVWREHGVGL